MSRPGTIVSKGYMRGVDQSDIYSVGGLSLDRPMTRIGSRAAAERSAAFSRSCKSVWRMTVCLTLGAPPARRPAGRRRRAAGAMPSACTQCPPQPPATARRQAGRRREQAPTGDRTGDLYGLVTTETPAPRSHTMRALHTTGCTAAACLCSGDGRSR